MNLYGFLGNNGLARLDFLGLDSEEGDGEEDAPKWTCSLVASDFISDVANLKITQIIKGTKAAVAANNGGFWADMASGDFIAAMAALGADNLDLGDTLEPIKEHIIQTHRDLDQERDIWLQVRVKCECKDAKKFKSGKFGRKEHPCYIKVPPYETEGEFRATHPLQGWYVGLAGKEGVMPWRGRKRVKNEAIYVGSAVKILCGGWCPGYAKVEGRGALDEESR